MKLAKYLLERQRDLRSIKDQSPELQAQIDLLDEILVYAKLQNVDLDIRTSIIPIERKNMSELNGLNSVLNDIIKSGGVILETKNDLSEDYFVTTITYISGEK
jgi:hypothetical protein